MPENKPGTTRTARAFALGLASLGLTFTGLGATATVAPAAQAVETSQAGGPGPSPAQVRNNRVLAAKNIAMSQRGDAYSYGAAGPSAFDCSGLIHYAYKRAGFAVPRTSGALAAHTRRIAKQHMRAGDLMFFANGGGVYHAAIFLGWSRGRAMMVHSPSTGSRVHVAPAWTSSWFGGTLR